MAKGRLPPPPSNVASLVTDIEKIIADMESTRSTYKKETAPPSFSSLGREAGGVCQTRIKPASGRKEAAKLLRLLCEYS